MARERPQMDHELVTSASQIKTWQDCKLKWWFRMMGLKEPEQDFKTQGNVLHGVMERWMLGKPTEEVDLYPEGWDEGVSPAFAQLIQKLVAVAIDSGIVIKEPGTRCEVPIVLDIVPDVGLLGYADVAHYKGIDDHKTTSNMQYALSPEELANDAQMLIYAYWWLLEEEKAGRSPLQVRLKHIVYLKNERKPRVKPEHTLVSAEDVLKHWNEVVVPIAEQMLAMKREFCELSMWKAVPATDDPKVCKKYRGCPYARICGGVESPDAYLARQERLLKGYAHTTQEGPKVDLTKKLLAKRAMNGGASPSVSVNAAVQNGMAAIASIANASTAVVQDAIAALNTKQKETLAAIADRLETQADADMKADDSQAEYLEWKAEKERVAAQAQAVAKAEAPAPAPVAADKAPWANAGCVACAGTGWNKEGRPCKACDAYNGAKGLPKSDTFTGVKLPDVVGPATAVEAKPITENPVVTEPKPKRTRKPKAEAVEAEAEAEVEAPEKTVTVTVTEKSADQPLRKGPDLVLLVNAVSTSPEFLSQDLMADYNRITARIANAAGVSDFLEMDSWKRKDILAIHVKEWSKTVKGTFHAIGGGQDFKVMVDTLRGLSNVVVVQGVL